MFSVKELRVVLTLTARNGALVALPDWPPPPSWMPPIAEQEGLAIYTVGEHREGLVLIPAEREVALLETPLSIPRLYEMTAAFDLAAPVYVQWEECVEPTPVSAWRMLEPSGPEDVRIAVIAQEPNLQV